MALSGRFLVQWGEKDSIRWYHWYPLMNGLFILVLALVCLIWHQAVVVRQALEMECEEMVIFSAKYD